MILQNLLWNFFLNDEHRNRILALFDLDSNALTTYGYQQYQSKVSIASGELTGYGLGKGYHKEPCFLSRTQERKEDGACGKHPIPSP